MVTSWASKQSCDSGITSNYASKAEVSIPEDKENNSGPVNMQVPIHKARTEFKSADVLVPFKGTSDGTSDDSEAVHRFYHVFEKGEMEYLAQITGFFS